MRALHFEIEPPCNITSLWALQSVQWVQGSKPASIIFMPFKGAHYLFYSFISFALLWAPNFTLEQFNLFIKLEKVCEVSHGL